jgi:uncharacterized FlgJ-related protein
MRWHNSHLANCNTARNIRKIKKYSQQKKTQINEIIKITPKNNSLNNINVKEKFVK